MMSSRLLPIRRTFCNRFRFDGGIAVSRGDENTLPVDLTVAETLAAMPYTVSEASDVEYLVQRFINTQNLGTSVTFF